MKNLSQKARYALRALELLGRERGNGPVLIADIARREKIPQKFLENILLELRNAGLVSSKRGKGGGYELRKAPQEITYGHVIRIFDGLIAPLPCVSVIAYVPCAECADVETCATRLVMKELRDVMVEVLDGTTLADSLERVEKLQQIKRRKRR